MRLSIACVFLSSILLLGSCREGGQFLPRDAGGMRTCSETAECLGEGICVAGICQTVSSCSRDEQCSAEGKVCHSSRFYCVECDGSHPGECSQGMTCQFDFTCVPIGASDAGVGDASACSGTCTDRNQCPVDTVCRMGACCTPPRRCFSPNDCPRNRPECNGATGECFGGDGCFGDGDCATQPGCGGGACRCDLSAGSPGTCVVRQTCASDADCLDTMANYVGKFCTLNQTPARCADAPQCTSDAPCLADGLVCDLEQGSPSMNRCRNGVPCPMGNECNPTTQTCVNGSCAAKTCLNTPGLCTGTDTCDTATGQCIPMMGGTCSDHPQCPMGYFCNTASAPGRCEVGCRDSAECPNGVCGATHQCEFPNGAICGPCMNPTDCPSGSRCVNNPLTGMSLCYEQCSSITGQTCSDTTAQCIFGNCSCVL